MRNCCVPYCSSTGKNSKERGLSFHELPCDWDLRKIWLNNIRRTNFTPNDCTRVCSRHFNETDFVPERKIRILKPGTIPTVFPEYPKYLQVQAAKRAQKRPPPKVRRPFPKKVRVHVPGPKETKEKHEVLRPVEEAVEHSSGPTPKPVISPTPISVSVPPLQLVSRDADVRSAQNEASSQACAEVQQVMVPVCLEQIIEVKRGRPSTSLEVMKRAKRKCQYENSHLKKLNDRLRAKLVQLNEQLSAAQSTFSLPVKKIIDDAQAGSREAVFLLDQLKAYDNMRPQWSEETVNHCLLCQMESPTGYEFVCKKLRLRLPSRATLKRYKRAISENVNGTCLVLPAEIKAQKKELESEARSCSHQIKEIEMRGVDGSNGKS